MITSHKQELIMFFLCFFVHDQTVVIKQLDRHGFQGNNEFLDEVSKLSRLHHDNLVDIIGYCADGDQRLLVYEFMSAGNLEEHLFGTHTHHTPQRERIL